MLLDAKHLTRTLQGDIPVTLVKDADVSVNLGEFVAITGPSGSGKSSLLYILGLLDRPTSGTVTIDGQDTSKLGEDALARFRLEKMGFIFQFHFLLAEFTALENVMLPMRRLGKLSDRDIRDRARQLLRDLGLEEQADKLPKQMSGGQAQRVAIARALSNRPRLILADEPTGNLDTVSSHNVQTILKELAATGDCSVVAVTHDTSFADFADRRIHIVDGVITDNKLQPQAAP